MLIVHEAEEACRGPAPAHEIDGEGELGVRGERVPDVPVHHSSEAEWNVDERLAQLGELAQGRGQVFAERAGRRRQTEIGRVEKTGIAPG